MTERTDKSERQSNYFRFQVFVSGEDDLCVREQLDKLEGVSVLPNEIFLKKVKTENGSLEIIEGRAVHGKCHAVAGGKILELFGENADVYPVYIPDLGELRKWD